MSCANCGREKLCGRIYCTACESALRSIIEKAEQPRISPELAKRIAAEVASELNLYSGLLTDTEAVNRIAHIIERVGNADA
jgi:uncharacterized Zn finger protein (UPF0148 family)